MTVMARRWSKGTATTATALIVAILAISASLCIEAATASEHACCVAMAGQCGATMAAQHECCKTEAAKTDQQVAAAAAIKLQKPAVGVVVVLGLIEFQSRELGLTTIAHAHSGSPPTNRGVPSYLVLSTLRV